jgi:putative DNA primase/helicase
VLNWAVEGYQRLERQGKFTNEPRPMENRRLWEQYGNSVEQFVSQHLERAPSESVRKDRAYDAYKKFAKAEGMEVVTKHKFTSELKAKGASVNQRRFDGDRERVYTGFQWSGERPGASATEELEGDIEELFG